ncbi:hypothetical protein [uncultured Mameliella sp.]|uniref:acyltransferase family protein n=1 Tax=uncultured Mameliella sp. TaxID=1447087 RepID=UPI00261FEDDD|nr:hypothetical protein [uncultured Mameliella sp.]
MMLPARVTDNFAVSVYGNLVVLEFALGVLAYRILAERSAYRILAVAFFIVVSALFHNASTGHRFYAFGLPAFALVTVCVYFLSNVRMPSFLVMLGGASYALYLTHLYIIRIFVKLTDWFDGTATEQVMATVISIVIVNVLALAFYKFLEIPINRFLRRRLLVRPHKTDLNNGLNTAP